VRKTLPSVFVGNIKQTNKQTNNQTNKQTNNNDNNNNIKLKSEKTQRQDANTKSSVCIGY